MNREGYRDPTAEKAVSNVMKDEKRNIITGWIPPDAYKVVKPVIMVLSMMGFSVTLTLRDADGGRYTLRMQK